MICCIVTESLITTVSYFCLYRGLFSRTNHQNFSIKRTVGKGCCNLEGGSIVLRGGSIDPGHGSLGQEEPDAET